MIKNEKERYWLAGILEGEGCFGSYLHKVKGKSYRYPLVSIISTDLDIVERVRDLIAPNRNIGIRKESNPRAKQAYQLSISNELALDVMLVVRDLMGERRQAKIDKVLALPVGRVVT